MGNYSRIYFKENKKLVQRSLNYLESVLDKELFFRINRSQIINIQFIERMDTCFNGKLKLRLQTGEVLEVSRRKSAEIKNMFRL